MGGRGDTEGLAALRGVALLAGVPEAALHRLAAHVEPVTVVGGERVVGQGEPADALYIVRRGRLRTLATGADGVERTLGEFGAGDLFGELGLLSDRPRAASVWAIRDSELLRLSASDFQAIVAAEPTMLRGLAANLAERIATATPTADHRRSTGVATIAVLPTGEPPTDAHAFAGALERSLEDHGPAVVVAGPGPSLDALEAMHRFVVLVCDAEATEWNERCLRQADQVLVVADRGARRVPSPAERAVAGAPRAPRVDLVLLHPAGQAPANTRSWLQGRAVRGHHHVRLADERGLDRLARVLAGADVGLALAGGGPRGFVHLGVLRALDERAVPIDTVIGTSIGAIMGAAYALGHDDDTRCARALRALRDTKHLFGATFPAVSLSSGATITTTFQAPELFGDTDIEDLWIPFGAVAANLTRSSAVLLESGPVWWALRASSSLPGLLPPVWHEGDLLVDGGVVDNLPVDAARARVGGPVIAVDLSPGVEHGVVAAFPPVLSGWRVLRDRLRPRKRSHHLPNPIELLLRAKDISVRQIEREQLSLRPADLYLNPPTAGYPMLDFSRSAELIDVGYRYAIEELEVQAPTLAAFASSVANDAHRSA